MTRSAGLRRALLAAAAVLVLCLLPFLSGLVGALILFVLMEPPYRRLARVIPRRAAAFLIALAAAVIVLIPGTWLATSIIGEARDAIASLQQGSALDWISNVASGDTRLSRGVAAVGTNVVGWLSGRAFALFGSVTATLLNLVIAFFGLYYLLIDGPGLWNRARRLLPVSASTARNLADRFVAVTEALLLGTMLTAVLQGTIVGAGFAMTGLHSAIFWGFVTACVSVLPVLGSSIVWLPGVIVLVAQHRPGSAILLAVMGAGLASNIDNIVRPFVYRRVSGIHPMLTLVGAFAGVRLLGVIGVFVGPLMLSYFFELIELAEDEAAHAAPAPAARAVEEHIHAGV